MEQSLHRCCSLIWTWACFAKKIYWLVQYNPTKCFNNSFQTAVKAKIEADENSKSSVAAGPMKLLANSSHGNPIMDWSRNAVTKNVSDETTHGAITNKMFTRLGYISDQQFEVELVNSEIEQTEAIIFGFFFLQHAKVTILDL